MQWRRLKGAQQGTVPSKSLGGRDGDVYIPKFLKYFIKYKFLAFPCCSYYYWLQCCAYSSKVIISSG